MLAYIGIGSNLGDKLKNMVHPNIRNFPEIISLAVDVNAGMPYSHFTKIGLIFTDNLVDIRRAYLKSLQGLTTC